MSRPSPLSLFIFIIFCTLHQFCIKTSEGIDDIIVDFVNGTYMDENTFELSINYNDDSTNSMKILVDIIQELPKIVYMKVKVWGRAFGQYKLPTGISLDLNMCDGTMQKYFVSNAMKSMGINSTACPPKPGRYQIDNYDTNAAALLSAHNIKGLQILIEFEMYSPPPTNVSILKLQAFLHL